MLVRWSHEMRYDAIYECDPTDLKCDRLYSYHTMERAILASFPEDRNNPSPCIEALSNYSNDAKQSLIATSSIFFLLSPIFNIILDPPPRKPLYIFPSLHHQLQTLKNISTTIYNSINFPYPQTASPSPPPPPLPPLFLLKKYIPSSPPLPYSTLLNHTPPI